MEILEKENPLLQQEDYFRGYQDNIDEQKQNRPAVVEFERLCYELFEINPQGKKFLELATERYLIQAMAARAQPTYQLDVLWAEGFKDAWRLLLNCVNAHKQRIVAGKQ